MTPRIYVSFRDEDREDGRALVERLETRFDVVGSSSDPRSREAGTVEVGVQDCTHLIVVVGPGWSRAGVEGAETALIEVGAALREGLVIIPVLVRGAELPRGPGGPPALAALATLPALEIPDPQSASALESLLSRLSEDGDAEAESAAASFEISGDEPDPPPAQLDTVKCSVFAPPAARPGDAIMVQVFAHLPGDDGTVKALADAFDSTSAVRAAKQLDRDVRRGSTLSFALSMPGLAVDDPIQTLVWRGAAEAVQFGVQVPGDRRDGKVIGTVVVSQDTVPIGHLKFTLEVTAAVASPAASAPSTEPAWTRYRHAFISYASPDRAEVLKRVQMLDRVSIKFFQDILSLEPGERWARTLYKKIDESDVFYLFWSKAAKQSEWVLKEVQYALERRKGDEQAPPEIVPIIIEGPPHISPPPELRDLHFNDRFMYFIAGSAPAAASPRP